MPCINKNKNNLKTMPEELNTIVLGENDLRLETLTLPNGNTYILGCSFEEAQDIYDVLSGNIEAVNDEVEELKESEEVVAASLIDLDSRIVALTNDVETLKNSEEDTADDLSDLEARVDTLSDDVDSLNETEYVVAASLTDLNSRITALTQENTSLRNEITELRQEIALIKNNYMAYYDVDESKGIGENNVYTR